MSESLTVDVPFADAVEGDVYLTPDPLIPLRTLSSRIIVEPIEEEYKGLLILPKTAKKEPPIKGRVVSVGPGMLTKDCKRWPMPDVKPGDIVLFYKHSAQTFEMNGKEYLNVRDDSLQAVLEEE